MKLLYYEIKKVLSKRIFLGLLAFCFIVNLSVFYFTHNDYRSIQYRDGKDIYEDMITHYADMPLDQARTELEDAQLAYQIMTEMKMAGESTNADILNYELEQLDEYRRSSPEAYAKAEEMLNSSRSYDTERYSTTIILSQLQYLEEYPTFISEMKERADEQTTFSVFSDKDSFSYKNILRTAEDYAGLENTKLTLGNDFSFTEALNYRATDYFLIAVILMLCVYLFRFERDKGLYSLVRSSKRGRLQTVAAKLGAMMLLTALITVLFGFSIFAESTILFGKWDFSRTIQSISDFRNCILPLTCDSFSLLFLFGKVMFMLLIAAIFAAVFIAVSNTALTYGLSVGVIAGEYLLYRTAPFELLRYVNVFYGLDGAQIFGKYHNLDIFTQPVRANTLTILAAIIIVIAALLLSVLFFTLKGQESSANPLAAAWERFKQKHGKIRGTTRIWNGELYKYLISSRMAIVMLVLLIFAVVSSLGTVQYRSTDKAQNAYRDYLAAYQGQTPEQAAPSLAEERGRFEQLRQRAEKIEADETLSQHEKETALRSIDSILSSNGAGFEMVDRQYERLIELEKQSVNAIFADEIICGDFIYNPHREWQNTLLSLMLLVLTLPFIFTFEYRREMIDLLSATRGGRLRLFRAKMLIAFLSTLFTFAVCYVPFIIRFIRSFGTKSISAPLVCVETYAQSGMQISVGFAYALELLAYFMLMLFALSVIVILSLTVKNHFLSTAASASALLIPMLVLYGFKGVRVGALFTEHALLKWSVLTVVLILVTTALIILSALKFTGIKLKRKDYKS